MAVGIGNITDGSILGNGYFDIMMRSAKAHLKEEYSAGRITGSQYGELYVSMLNAVMAQAVQFAIQEESTNKQSEFVDQKIKTERAQTEDSIDGVAIQGIAGKQMSVHTAQAKGYRYDSLQKSAKMHTDIFSVLQSTGTTVTVPDALTSQKISDSVDLLVNELKAG